MGLVKGKNDEFIIKLQNAIKTRIIKQLELAR